MRRPLPAPSPFPRGPLLFAGAIVVLGLASLVTLLRTTPAPEELTPEEVEVLAWSAPAESTVGAVRPEAPASAGLYLATTPSGATAWLNADRIGTTPLRLRYVEPGYHFVSVEHPGYAAVDTLLLLEGGDEVHLDLMLQASAPASSTPRSEPAPEAPEEAPPVAEKPRDTADPSPPAAGALRIASRPAGAEVWIGGQRRGRTPLHLDDLPPGTYTVAFVHPDFAQTSHRVRVSAGKTAMLDATLAPRPTGTLVVSVRPWGSIYVDGELRHAGSASGPQPSTHRATLAPGTYRIRVTHPQFGSWDRTVEVSAGRVAEVHFDLAALSADADPIPRPGRWRLVTAS